METPKADQALRECVQTISDQIDELTRLIAKLLRSRKDLRPQMACLRSIPGIGPLTIACILAETSGFAESHKISQLISFSAMMSKSNSRASGPASPNFPNRAPNTFVEPCSCPPVRSCEASRGRCMNSTSDC